MDGEISSRDILRMACERISSESGRAFRKVSAEDVANSLYIAFARGEGVSWHALVDTSAFMPGGKQGFHAASFDRLYHISPDGLGLHSVYMDAGFTRSFPPSRAVPDLNFDGEVCVLLSGGQLSDGQLGEVLLEMAKAGGSELVLVIERSKAEVERAEKAKAASLAEIKSATKALAAARAAYGGKSPEVVSAEERCEAALAACTAAVRGSRPVTIHVEAIPPAASLEELALKLSL